MPNKATRTLADELLAIRRAPATESKGAIAPLNDTHRPIYRLWMADLSPDLSTAVRTLVENGADPERIRPQFVKFKRGPRKRPVVKRRRGAPIMRGLPRRSLSFL